MEPISRRSLKLLKIPIWIKVGPYPLECDRKDLMHAIGSFFGGLIQTESKGEYCRIRVMIKLHRPLRRGIFVLDEDQNKSWVLFKYERLPGFCFGCGRIGHLVKDCGMIFPDVKNMPEDDMPFSLALKAELIFPSKLSMHLGEKN